MRSGRETKVSWIGNISHNDITPQGVWIWTAAKVTPNPKCLVPLDDMERAMKALIAFEPSLGEY